MISVLNSNGKNNNEYNNNIVNNNNNKNENNNANDNNNKNGYLDCLSQATTGTVVMTPQQQPLQPGPTMAPQGYVQSYPVEDYGQGYDQDQALPLKV